MTERIVIEHLYKVFSDRPEGALRRLADGATKDKVLAETGEVVGLNDVSLSIPSGAIYMIMGLSGSGKSTLARCINRLIEPSKGRVLLDGEDIVTASESRLRDMRRTRISMVFQHFALFPNRTVLENIEFGLKLRGVSQQARRQKSEQILSVVGLSRWGYHVPGALSGGMRQRVGLARALATDADVLIMDEAFSALDPLIRAEMQDELLRLQRTLNKTILFITHDFQEALKLGSRIAIMADGKVMREGTPQEIVLSPGSDYVADFTKDVDRGRLFDAQSVMSDAVSIRLQSDGTLVTPAVCRDSHAFVIDESGRVMGVVAAADIPSLSNAARARSMASTNFVSVAAQTKLTDVAANCRAGAPIAVVDETGRLVGRIELADMLVRIGSAGPMPAPQVPSHPPSSSQSSKAAAYV